MLRNRPSLTTAERWALQTWLQGHPELSELYEAKEALHSLCRIRGADRAATALTNGRTEGFNNKAKLVKGHAYGYRSFQNYRRRLLNACA